MAKKKGFGTLVLRGSTYYARWVVDGKVYTRTTQTGNKKQAEKMLEDFTRPFREKSDIEIIENLKAKVRVKEVGLKNAKNESIKPIEILDLVDVYKNDLDTGKMTEGSENLYERMVKRFHDLIGVDYCHQVNEKMVDGFMSRMKKDCAECTYNRYLVVLRCLFKCAMKKDYRIRSNPFEHLKKLKLSKEASRRELTNGEVEKLIEVAKEQSDDMFNLFVIGAYTGLRKSDICSLKWSNVDFKNNVLRVLPMKTRKNGQAAIIPIHNKVKEIIDGLEMGDGFVFNSLHSKYVDGSVEGEINKVFKLANIEKSEKDENGKTRIRTGFHALRVYFASQCSRNGVPINQIKTMLAHARVDMSLHYVNTQVSDLTLPEFDENKKMVRVESSLIDRLERLGKSGDFEKNLLMMVEYIEDELRKKGIENN